MEKIRIKQIRSSIKTFSATLTHAVLNDLSFVNQYLSNYFDVNRIVLEFEFDSTGIAEEFFLLLEDGSFLLRD